MAMPAPYVEVSADLPGPGSPPPAVDKNMALSMRLMEYMEDDPSLAEKLNGHIVIHIVPGHDHFNEYNRWVAAQRQESECKSVMEVHWPEGALG